MKGCPSAEGGAVVACVRGSSRREERLYNGYVPEVCRYAEGWHAGGKLAAIVDEVGHQDGVDIRATVTADRKVGHRRGGGGVRFHLSLQGVVC